MSNSTYNTRHLAAIGYTPFGSVLSGRGWSDPSLRAKYKYGFNGESKEDDINGDGMSYDLGARFYDSRLGRMFSVDPLQARYPFWSPYSYCGNNPVTIVDIKGLGNGKGIATNSTPTDYINNNTVTGDGKGLVGKLEDLVDHNPDVFVNYHKEWSTARKLQYWSDKGAGWMENFKAGVQLKINDLPGPAGPTKMEAAMMAKHVYGESANLGRWNVSSDAPPGFKLNDKSGFKSQLYETVENGIKRYVYAFAGTENLDDWANNAQQISGQSFQYYKAIENAKGLNRSGIYASYIGHSLGGGYGNSCRISNRWFSNNF